MIKIIITIEDSENKIKEDNTIKGKYIIANSNFGDAYILGVPCKVVSEPFMGTYKPNVLKKKECLCIKVVSCITGIRYTIPYDMNWIHIYDTFTHVFNTSKSKSFLDRGYNIYRNPEILCNTGELKGKKYYPIDNSYAEALFNIGNSRVAGEEVEILSGVYNDITPYGDKILFVTVQKNDGSIVKCMFMEHKLLP